MRSFFTKLFTHKNALLYALIALLLFVFVIRLISFNLYPLMSTTEARYAEMSRKMLELNEWIVLYYYDYETPFWGKPPLSFWASAGTMWLFGVNEFGARFAPFVFGLLSCAMFFLWQFRRESQEYGESWALRPIACAVILSTSGLGFVAMGAVMTDEALLFCVMLCMISFWRCCFVADSPCGNLSLDKHSADLLDFTHPLAPSAREGESNSSLRDSRSESKQSKSRESKQQKESMVQKQINADSLQVRDSQKAQILHNRLPRLDCVKSRNDEAGTNCHDFTQSVESRNDDFGADCFDSAITESRNDSVAVNSPKNSHTTLFGYLFFVGLGLGLLAKGPLIFVLVGLPIVAFLIALRFFAPKAQRTRILHLKNLPIFSGSILMLLIALPWYIAFEMKSAGFLEYFIIGEHFKRFFVSGWEGSMYGAAHSQPIGTIWWFFFISFLPWSVVFLGFVARKIYGFFNDSRDFKARDLAVDSARIALIKPQNLQNLYLALWILMPLCFLTFSRNILEAYTLPCAPAFCILMTNFIFGIGGGAV